MWRITACQLQRVPIYHKLLAEKRGNTDTSKANEPQGFHSELHLTYVQRHSTQLYSSHLMSAPQCWYCYCKLSMAPSRMSASISSIFKKFWNNVSVTRRSKLHYVHIFYVLSEANFFIMAFGTPMGCCNIVPNLKFFSTTKKTIFCLFHELSILNFKILTFKLTLPVTLIIIESIPEYCTYFLQ